MTLSREDGDDPGERSAAAGSETGSGGADHRAQIVGEQLSRTVRAGLEGERVSSQGVLEAIGGWRGVFEAVVPGAVYLGVYTFTQDPRVSAIAPAILALIAVAIRLVRREPLASAFSGALAVGVCVLATLVTGRGEDYFLPGFWTSGAWAAGLLVSLLVGWPLIGFAFGALRGDFTAWRSEPALKRAATVCTLIWFAMFVSRLAVQLPMYFGGHVEALGVARLVMGIPLFALVILLSWLILSRFPRSSDESEATTGNDAPSA